MPFDWHGKGGPYIESRRQAEDMVLQICPGSWTAGGRDVCVLSLRPARLAAESGPDGEDGALGKIPVYVNGVSTEVVGIEDVAEAFLLAGERGRIGERYIISESYMSMREMFETAAIAVGTKPPRFGVPLAAIYATAFVTQRGGATATAKIP